MNKCNYCGDKKTDAELEEKGYDIPFINPVPMMVELARALVRLKLTHSPLSYPGFKWPSGSAKFVR